jgi:hypothetical protein
MECADDSCSHNYQSVSLRRVESASADDEPCEQLAVARVRLTLKIDIASVSSTGSISSDDAIDILATIDIRHNRDTTHSAFSSVVAVCDSSNKQSPKPVNPSTSKLCGCDRWGRPRPIVWLAACCRSSVRYVVYLFRYHNNITLSFQQCLNSALLT